MQDSYDRPCIRFKTEPDYANFTYGAAYSVLREAGCPSSKAKVLKLFQPHQQFITRKQCKVDSTILFHGPKKFTNMKLEENKYFIKSGWSYLEKNYIIPGLMTTSGLKSINVEDNKQEQQFEKHMATMYKSYDRMKIFGKYVSQLNEKYSLNSKGMSKETLNQKIRQLATESHQKYNQTYEFTVGNRRYVELASDLVECRQQRLTQNQPTEMQGNAVFSDLLSSKRVINVEVTAIHSDDVHPPPQTSEKSINVRPKIKKSILSSLSSNRIAVEKSSVNDTSLLSPKRQSQNSQRGCQVLEDEVVRVFKIEPTKLLMKNKCASEDGIEWLKQQKQDYISKFRQRVLSKGQQRNVFTPSSNQMGSTKMTFLTRDHLMRMASSQENTIITQTARSKKRKIAPTALRIDSP